MKVRCITNDPLEFQVAEAHRERYIATFGRGAVKRYATVTVGETYVVYAILLSSIGYVNYFVRHTKLPGSWHSVPSLCFEVIDNRVSKYWHFRQSAKVVNGEERFWSTLAIREWIEAPSFHERLIDRNPPEVAIFSVAARLMDDEYA